VAILESVANNMVGKCFCLLGEFATSPVLSTIKFFRHEFEARVKKAA
jgi:NADH:ubiquinone oxidoreductase subunit F (NADH-binding)